MTEVKSFSFTGPSHLSDRAVEMSVRILLATDPHVLWRSGGAEGLDSLVAAMAERCELVVPKDLPYNEKLRTLDSVVNTIEVPGTYRKRNKELVSGTDVLHAFVYSTDFYRSGEWMTINIARHLGVPVHMHKVER